MNIFYTYNGACGFYIFQYILYNVHSTVLPLYSNDALLLSFNDIQNEGTVTFTVLLCNDLIIVHFEFHAEIKEKF